jgi:hypothetical protein
MLGTTTDSADWVTQELIYLLDALRAMEKVFGGLDELEAAIGNVTLIRGGSPPFYYDKNTAGETKKNGTITFYDNAFDSSAGQAIYDILHEFGHVFDHHGGGWKSNKYEDKFWRNCLGVAGKCLFGIGEAKPTVIDPINSYNPREDFASTFAAAIWLRTDLDVLAVVPSYINFGDYNRMEYMFNLIGN